MKVYIVMEWQSDELVNMTVCADTIAAQNLADSSDNYAYVIEKDVV